MKYLARLRWRQVVSVIIAFVVFSIAALAAGCNSSSDDDDSSADDDTTNNLDITICDPSNSGFTTEITNPYFPMPVGAQWVLEGEEDGAALHIEITVLDETEDVAGVTTLVREEREFADEVLVEVSRNFFVQTSDGTVCYYGEDVDTYDADGNVVDHLGAWRAGVDGSLPGIQMPADPAVGMSYDQEVAPGIAQDHGEITSMGDSLTVPFGSFTDTITIIETSVIEPDDVSLKQYAKNLGVIQDDTNSLVGYSAP